MLTLLLRLLRLLPVLFGGHRQLAIESLALRHQLSVYKRPTIAPCFARPIGFSGSVSHSLDRVRQSLVIVTPATVLRWQRRRFREYWTQLSGGSTGGRPPVNAEIKALLTRMATANPLWGAPLIHGEILKLGVDGPSAPCLA